MITAQPIEASPEFSGRHRLLALLSLVSLAATAIWLALFVANMVAAGPLDTFAQTLAYVSRLDTLFFLSYINATLITLAVTLLFAALYAHVRQSAPAWAAIGLLFLPFYTALNLIAYLSQLTIVPALLALRPYAESQAVINALLRLVIQQWPGSIVNVINNLGYAVLGIPSIIFGLLLYRQHPRLRLAGALLVASGAASIVGMGGILTHHPLLSWGSVVSGVLFMLALLPLGLAFLRGRTAPI